MIQHYTLRMTLSLWGRLPWNLPKILEYSRQLVLLRGVGGGYMFIHRLLLEHFAAGYSR